MRRRSYRDAAGKIIDWCADTPAVTPSGDVTDLQKRLSKDGANVAVFGLGVLFAVYGRWSSKLGWKGNDTTSLRFLQPGEVGITKAQKSTAWFFLVVSILFLIQATVGASGALFGLMAALLDHSETEWQAAVMSGPPPLGPGWSSRPPMADRATRAAPWHRRGRDRMPPTPPANLAP